MNRLVYVDWAIASVCNLHCRHCVGMEPGELSHKDAVSVARQIIELAPQWVILEGGEPLFRRDLKQIGSMFYKANIDTFVITNGNAFTETKLKALASFSPKVLFSFDGADKESYEYVKRGARFDTALKWAARCAEAGIFQGITAVLTRQNKDQATEFIRLTEKLGGKQVIFLPLKPFYGNAESDLYYEQHAMKPEDHEEVVKVIYGNPGKIEIFYDEPFLWNLSRMNGFNLSSSESGITIPEVQGCAVAYSLYIQTDGSVRPCMFCPTELTYGNAAIEPLKSIWNRMQSCRNLTDWADQKLKEGPCSICAQFETCRGCLARTEVLMDSMFASDPCCPMRR